MIYIYNYASQRESREREGECRGMKILANEIELDVENAVWRVVIEMLRGVVQFV